MLRVEDVLACLACGSLQVQPVEGEGLVRIEIDGLINRSRLVRVRLIGMEECWQDRLSHAVILERSSDWYRHSLHCYSHLAELIIAGLHDSLVDVPVVAVGDEKFYPSGCACVQSFSEEHFPEKLRKTAFGHRLFLGALLAGRPDALERLKRLPASTRRRIEAEVKQLRLRRPGRPLSLS